MKMNVIMSLLEELSLTDVDFEDIEIDGATLEVNNMEFMVLDEDEKQECLKNNIRETASYFNASFLAAMTELPEKVFEALTDENEAVCELIEKTCGMDKFIDEACRCDGAGHFLNNYDGNEYELSDGYYAYRTN
jgi:hypothetical protein